MELFIGLALVLIAINQWRLEDRMKSIGDHSLAIGTGVIALLSRQRRETVDEIRRLIGERDVTMQVTRDELMEVLNEVEAATAP